MYRRRLGVYCNHKSTRRNREPSQAKFTAGRLRDLAREIEFRIKKDNK